MSSCWETLSVLIIWLLSHLLFCDKCYRVLSLYQAIYVDDFLSDQTHWILNGELQIQHQVDHLFPCENRVISMIRYVKNSDIFHSKAQCCDTPLRKTQRRLLHISGPYLSLVIWIKEQISHKESHWVGHMGSLGFPFLLGRHLEYISQPPLKLHMSMYLSSSQWNVGRND